jgi:hypothetical protein
VGGGGGGGGAGGFRTGTSFSVTAGTSYTVTVGGGGAGGASVGANPGIDGSNSVFLPLPLLVVAVGLMAVLLL